MRAHRATAATARPLRSLHPHLIGRTISRWSVRPEGGPQWPVVLLWRPPITNFRVLGTPPASGGSILPPQEPTARAVTQRAFLACGEEDTLPPAWPRSRAATDPPWRFGCGPTYRDHRESRTPSGRRAVQSSSVGIHRYRRSRSRPDWRHQDLIDIRIETPRLRLGGLGPSTSCRPRPAAFCLGVQDVWLHQRRLSGYHSPLCKVYRPLLGDPPQILSCVAHSRSELGPRIPRTEHSCPKQLHRHCDSVSRTTEIGIAIPEDELRQRQQRSKLPIRSVSAKSFATDSALGRTSATPAMA